MLASVLNFLHIKCIENVLSFKGSTISTYNIISKLLIRKLILKPTHCLLDPSGKIGVRWIRELSTLLFFSLSSFLGQIRVLSVNDLEFARKADIWLKLDFFVFICWSCLHMFAIFSVPSYAKVRTFWDREIFWTKRQFSRRSASIQPRSGLKNLGSVRKPLRHFRATS